MAKFSYIQQAVEIFYSIDQWDDREIMGCSYEDLISLEKFLPLFYKMPAAYREFLIFGGKRLAYFLGDPVFSYSKVLDNLRDRYLQFKRDFGLEQDIWNDGIVIIDEHLSASFLFIRLSEGENPPVYFWEEEGALDDAIKISEHFSDFFLETIKTWKEQHTNAVKNRMELQELVNQFKKKMLDIKDEFVNWDRDYPAMGFRDLSNRFDPLSQLIYRVYFASIYKNIYDEIVHKLNVDELVIKLFKQIDNSLEPNEILFKIKESKLLFERIKLLEGTRKNS